MKSLICAIALLAALPALGGEAVQKKLSENDRLLMSEVTFKPGDTVSSRKRPMRAVYAIRGGTLERTYEDGTKEKSAWRTGESKLIDETRAYALKNVGKTTIKLFVVSAK